MNIKINRNANSIVKEKLSMENVKNVRKVLKRSIRELDGYTFFNQMQVYITKIGIILNECIYSYYSKPDTYLKSIRLICSNVIGNDQIYRVMKGININKYGNQTKHRTEEIKGDIDLTLLQYNEMIKKLVHATKIDAFKECYLHKEQNVRDVAFDKEDKFHKYFIVNDSINKQEIKMELKMNERYSYDLYSKCGSSKITLFWPHGHEGRYVDITVINNKNGRKMASKKGISIQNNESKAALSIDFKEDDLDRRVLSCKVKIEVYADRKGYYTTGALFWKQYHSYQTRDLVANYTQNLSQLYAEKNKMVLKNTAR